MAWACASESGEISTLVIRASGLFFAKWMVWAPTPQPAPTPERPTPAQAGEEKMRQAAVQNVQNPTYIKDENGRLRVETTLAGSGTRAVWIVDGSFQVAQAAN